VVTGAIGGSVWGTDIYTDHSHVAAAAVHAGIVSIGQIKTIHVKIVSGQLQYTGSTRNGITTGSYGIWIGSYSFIGNESTPHIPLPNVTNDQGKQHEFSD
jgi:hypothetical protein